MPAQSGLATAQQLCSEVNARNHHNTPWAPEALEGNGEDSAFLPKPPHSHAPSRSAPVPSAQSLREAPP